MLWELCVDTKLYTQTIFVIQALVLQHEDSQVTEWLPYLSVLFSPLQVIEFSGRASSRCPPCKPETCVWH